MEALQQQWDNTSAALEALQQADKRNRKHIGRLQQQAEVGPTQLSARSLRAHSFKLCVANKQWEANCLSVV